MIKVEGITKIYKTQHNLNKVLNSVSFLIEDGELLVLSGASGSGKSTLLNIIGFLDKDFNGKISYNNELYSDIKNTTNFRNQNIGFIFQSHSLIPEFSVKENILLPVIDKSNYKEKANYGDRLLEYFNLIQYKNSLPSMLSLGECQRIAIIRSLINNPQIVLADEPTGNLDKRNTEILLEKIDNLRKDFNTTFLIATHDENVLKHATRTLYLENGKIK